ncbi:MAG: hypothetical protein EZS28_052246 [Streblomastix strix]|uniref:Uncharacterized protein n=1 Tax=Streblomastix strix TaxID=222440 RepID=A0A5J4SGA3_9EUKA|nr:MAG: hypothetical protein EZS28_052246 [Streblomastix strix]
MQILLAKARREAEIERKLMQQELTQHRERAATASKRVRDAHDKLSQLQIEKNDLQQKIQEAEEQLRTTEIERQQVASDAAEQAKEPHCPMELKLKNNGKTIVGIINRDKK